MQGTAKNLLVQSVARFPCRGSRERLSSRQGGQAVPVLVPCARGGSQTSPRINVHITRASTMNEPLRGGRCSPTIIFDVMDTLVKDPFYTHMPGFFGLTFEELLKAKHPTAWLEFEKGQLSQEEFDISFFKDGRTFDSMALRQTMSEQYVFIEGMEDLLLELQTSGYDMHVMSNYPIWYRLVEQQCQVSRFMPWTFVSCEGAMKGLRKPDPACFGCAVRELQVDGADIIFVDDRKSNTDAALACGLQAIHFKGADELRRELQELGVQL